MSPKRVIKLRLDAPPKPAPGAPCNGCGVCCMAEPCPLGVVLSRRLAGRCVALRWNGARYVCGALSARPGGWRAWLVRRWIAAGAGCDCTLQTQAPPHREGV